MRRDVRGGRDWHGEQGGKLNDALGDVAHQIRNLAPAEQEHDH